MMLMVRHGAGVLIRLTPCIILCMVPFPRERFRVRFSVLLPVSLVLLLLYGVLSAIVLNSVKGNVGLCTMYDNIIMCFSCAAAFVYFVMVIDASLVQKLMAYCLSIMYGITLRVACNLLIEFVTYRYQRSGGDLCVPSFVCVLFAVTLVTFPFVYLFMRKILAPYLREIQTPELKRCVSLLAAMTLLYLGAAAVGNVYSGKYDNENAILFWSSCLLSEAVGIALVYWLLSWSLQQQRSRCKMEHLLEMQRLQYEKMSSDIKNMRRIAHDVKHQYHVFSQLLRAGDVEEVLRRLQKGNEFLGGMVQKHFSIEPGLNALFQYYAGETANEGIELKIQGDVQQGCMDNVEMTILFGNMLDNAYYACCNSPGPRYIHICMATIKGMLAITMENTCREVQYSVPVTMNENGYMPAGAFNSMKTGGGIGLNSMSTIAEKNGGFAEYKYENHVFITRIMIDTASNKN